MSLGTFQKRLSIIYRWEGVLTRDANDPGGLTKWGISQRAYPMLDIENLTRDEAEQIYRADYWNPCRCDELPAGLDLIVFDCAVNQGVRTATRCLQRALGVTDDGIIGPVTLAAVRGRKDRLGLIKEVAARRGKKYGEAATFQHHGLGWMRRLIDVTEIACSLATSK